jgi:hypothetical protein
MPDDQCILELHRRRLSHVGLRHAARSNNEIGSPLLRAVVSGDGALLLPLVDEGLVAGRGRGPIVIDPVNVAQLSGRVAAVGLSSPSLEPPVPIREEIWRELTSIISFQKLTGLAIAALEAGDLEATTDQRGQLVELHRKQMLHVVRLDRRLLLIADALEDAGVCSVVIKGPAVAYSMYPDPSWRAYGDIDLLVPTRQHARACAVLADLGFSRDLPDPRPGFTERFGYTAVFKERSGTEVDLHRSLFGGAFGLWMQPDALFGHLEEFVVGGRTLRRLDDTGLLLHACMHASLGYRPPLLLPLRDVMQIAAVGDIDWDRLASWARAWRLRAVISHAFDAAARRLGIDLPDEADTFIRSASASPVERRVLAAYTGDRRPFGGIELSTIRAVRGLPSKVAYVRAVCFPSREFMRARVGSSGWRAYWRRWRIPVVWGRVLGERSLGAVSAYPVRLLRLRRGTSQVSTDPGASPR